MVKPFGGDGFEGLLVEIRLDPLVLEGAFVTVIESARGKGASIDIGVVKAAKAHATSKTRAFIEFTPSPKYQRCKPGSVTLSISGNPLKCSRGKISY